MQIAGCRFQVRIYYVTQGHARTGSVTQEPEEAKIALLGLTLKNHPMRDGVPPGVGVTKKAPKRVTKKPEMSCRNRKRVKLAFFRIPRAPDLRELWTTG